MPEGDRPSPKRLRRSLTVLVAALSLSVLLAGIAAGQDKVTLGQENPEGGASSGQDQAPLGQENPEGGASPPSEGDPPSTGAEELGEDGERASADLSISPRDKRAEAELNSDFRYAFRVVNHGPETAKNVRAFLTPPSGFSIEDTSASCRRSPIDGAYDCVLDELRSGRDAVLILRGEFDEPGPSSHYASLFSETPDPALANNSTEQRVVAEGEGDGDKGDAVSKFESGAEGWTLSGDAAGKKPTWISSGGFIRAVDGVLGQTLYREAPAKFEGRKADSYGGKLSFDLRQSERDIQYDEDDVILKGAGTTLVFDAKNNPGTRWTQYTVELSEGAGWKVSGSGKPASEEQIRAVLSNLDRLAIRAEYRWGPDTDDLDNVVLEAKSDEAPDDEPPASDAPSDDKPPASDEAPDNEPPASEPPSDESAAQPADSGPSASP